MNKKLILPLVIIILLLLIVLGLFLRPKQEIKKVYLSEEYYQEGNFIEMNSEDMETLKDKTYILYIYNSYCKFPIPCDSIFEEFMTSYHISFVSMPFADFKETSYYPQVKYAPSIILIQEGKIRTYLDANADKDVNKYQDVQELKEWLEQYIYLSK